MQSMKTLALAIAFAIAGAWPLEASAGQPAARLNDTTAGSGGPGLILTGSANVLINSSPAARAGDTATCLLASVPAPILIVTVIAAGNPTVLINGSPAARKGDLLGFAGCTITSGSLNVFD